MTRPHQPPSPETLARVRSLSERRLTASEFADLEAIPISDEERGAVLSLVQWFRRRYPTAADRLAYVRRAYARWRRTAGD